MLRKVACATMILFAILIAHSALAPETTAQCTSCGVPTVGYQPVAYQSYARWYPRYRWNRPRWRFDRRVYPVTYTPVVQTVARPVMMTSYYGQPACSSCAGQQIVSRPLTYCNPCSACSPCSTCSPCSACSPCSTCVTSACSTCGVSPCSCPTRGTSSTDCPNCATTTTTSTPSTYTAPATQVQPTPATQVQPTLAPDENPPVQRTLRPETTDETADSSAKAADKVDNSNTSSSSSNFFEAPELFNPRDRVTQYSNPPVRMAVYQKPATTSGTSNATTHRAQAERDAMGWQSID